MAFKMTNAPFNDGRRTRKQRLLNRADKAHDRGYNRGAEIAGYRTVAEPRTLSTMEIPMTGREMKLREKAANVTPKVKKEGVISKVKGWAQGRTLLPKSVVPKAIFRGSKKRSSCKNTSWLTGK